MPNSSFSLFKRVFLFSLFMGGIFLFAQPDPSSYALSIRQASGPMKLDGLLDEAAWQEAEVATQFFQQFPFDSSYAQNRTEARVTFDEQYLYVSGVCYDQVEGDYIVASLKRDFSINNTDAFAVFIDPFNDKTNGFSFACSPLGVQREGLVQDGGGFGVTTSWDNRWFSEVRQFEDHWQVEMAIPFKTLRYKSSQRQWRINFARTDYKRNETSVWVPVPRTYNMATLAFTAVLNWEQAPPEAGANVSVIPYALGGYAADYQSANPEGKLRYGAGTDAKIGVTSSLNLDLTVFPDFSQVEVDRQVTNLDRFSIFFPERRQFFIENSDLFDRFGFSRIRPFFSRQIGLKGGQPVPILGGARLSGKVNRNWRVGLMTMQEEGTLNNPSQNYTVAAFQRRVFGISNIAGIFVNRQGFDGFKPDGNNFNRLVGADFNLFTSSNKWRGKAFYHQTFDNNPQANEGATAVWLMYNTPKLQVHYNHEYVGKNYNAEVGFVPRTGYFRFEPVANYWFYPSGGPIQSHGPGGYASVYWDDKFDLTDRQLTASYNFNFLNRSSLTLFAEDWFLKLTFPFDATGTGGTPLPEDNYYYRSFGGVYESDFRKKLSYSAYASYGSYFNGTRLNYGGSLNYRLQPWGNLGVTFERNEIRLPNPYPDANLWLISPRFEFSFSRSVFLTTFLQYNTQIRNFSMNTRLQWRFKPMSDVFLVFTENYGTDNFSIRNRAVVLKVNYWFTL